MLQEDILAFAANKTAAGERVALITVTAISGSSPASVGQVMAVLADGTIAGTVGGGASENHLIQQAQKAISDGTLVFTFSFDHAERGMACGGHMEGFGNVLGNQAGLIIFGGGHISQALAKIAILTGFSVTIVEDRPEFSEDFENVHYITCIPDEFETQKVLNNASYAVVCTRGHRTDADGLRYCLSKPLKYLGMIGSKKKVAEVMHSMQEEGFPQEVLNRVYAPIGLNIASQAPAEIAVAILAEILLVKNNGTPKHKKHQELGT